MPARAEVYRRPDWMRLPELLSWRQLSRLAELMGYEPHAAQLEFHQARDRFRVACCGRRFGKSKMAAFEVASVGVFGGYATAAAPTYSLASIVWQEAVDMIMGSPLRELVANLRTATGEQALELTTGGLIDARSTDKPRGLLGRGRDLLVLDEAAQEADPNVLYQYIRPSLTDRGGGLVLISTPRGDDWFHDEFKKGEAPAVRGYRSWQLPSAANPRLPRSEIESARSDPSMPDSIFRQEYLAVFLASVGSVFRGYREAAEDGVWLDAPEPDGDYVIGTDIAIHEDYTVAAVFDVRRQRFVHLQRWNQIDYPEQERMLVEMSRIWRAPMLIDATNNESVAQHVRDAVWWARVDGFKFTSVTKAGVINHLAHAIEARHLALLTKDHEMGKLAMSELGSYRYERTPSGTVRMSAPPGRHDDVVIALALAYEMARRHVGGLPIVAGSDGRNPAPDPLAGRYAPPKPASASTSKAVPQMRRRR